MMFTMREPYYGILISAMDRVIEPKVGTAGVGMSGNVFKLYYNPEFVDKLSIDSCFRLLKHEALHVAFNHFSIWETNAADEQEQHLRNIAEDMEINCYIDWTGVTDIHPVLPKDYNFEDSLGTRTYYSLLKDTLKQNLPNTLDNHSFWPCGDGAKERAEQITQIVEDLIVLAADECEKTCGTIPGEIKIKVDEIRSRKARPVACWKRYCRRFLGNSFSELLRISKKRESKRFPDFPGTRHQRKSKILVAIDTSGSVSMPEYKEFFGQIHTMTGAADFRVLECDSKITYEYDYRGKPNYQLHGGGGTSFEPPITYFLEHKNQFDALIYFTDGEAYVPNNTPQETLWVISSKGNKEYAHEFRKNGAKVVYIPPFNEKQNA